MKIDVLISTMNQKSFDLIKKMNIQSDVILINQFNKNNIRKENNSDDKVVWIDSKECELSKSRNLAIKNSKALKKRYSNI